MPRTAKHEDVPLLTDEEEAELQIRMAADPDAHELTDEELAGLRPAREVLPPALYEALTRRGRPKSPNKRVQVTLRVDPEALAAFKATGPGWQGRINDVLVRDAARLRRTDSE